jgi:hypothetical protein
VRHAQRFSFGLFSAAQKAFITTNCAVVTKKKSDFTPRVRDSNTARKTDAKHLKDGAKYNKSVGYLLGCLVGREVIGCLIEWIINSVTTADSTALVI